MAKRKSVKEQEVLDIKKKELEEAELRYKQELEAEKKVLEDMETVIKEMEESRGVFCGIILGAEDIAAVVQLALKSKENVRIPFKLYYNE
jgi:hypothetical protein